MSDINLISTEGSDTSFAQVLGFEWVRPNAQTLLDLRAGRHLAVAIETSVGPLVLARVEQFQHGRLRGIRRVAVLRHELNQQDC